MTAPITSHHSGWSGRNLIIRYLRKAQLPPIILRMHSRWCFMFPETPQSLQLHMYVGSWRTLRGVGTCSVVCLHTSPFKRAYRIQLIANSGGIGAFGARLVLCYVLSRLVGTMQLCKSGMITMAKCGHPLLPVYKTFNTCAIDYSHRQCRHCFCLATLVEIRTWGWCHQHLNYKYT